MRCFGAIILAVSIGAGLTVAKTASAAELDYERARWDSLMEKYHYLHSSRLVGEALRYVATIDGCWVALIGWATPAMKCKPRAVQLMTALTTQRELDHCPAKNRGQVQRDSGSEGVPG